MSYKEKPQIKLYKYENNAFSLVAIIDDYSECSWENNRFQAGVFSISINYNITNALLFAEKLWVQFGNNPYSFGEINKITDRIGADGKGSQIRTITGYDARYIFKRRIIKSLNSENTWSMTAKGEICMRSLIADQCGASAEAKRRLPVVNTIPAVNDAIGSVYSVSESFSNLYEVLRTIATQTEIGWRIRFDGELTLEFYEGEDRRETVRFDTNYDSLQDGEFTDSLESYANSILISGKGTGADRDIYEGETGTPQGLDRFEAYSNQSEMTTEEEYEAQAQSMLSQYGQTLTVSGNGLAKCPYIYGEQYDVGDIITVSFSGKSAVVQILSVTEHWRHGAYDITFSFGKPQNTLSEQLQIMLRKIQQASDKTTATSSVKWYTIPTDTAMSASDVTYDTIGFTGDCGSGATFTLYLDDESTGAKEYNVYFKNLSGGKITLTTGKTGAENAVMNSGTYVARVYVDPQGNITVQSATATSVIESGNNQPATSDGVAQALKDYPDVTYYNSAHSENLNCNDITDRVCLVTAMMSNWASLNYPFQGLMFIITAKNEDGEGFQKAISWDYDGTFPEFTRVCKNGVWQIWKKDLTVDDVVDYFNFEGITDGDGLLDIADIGNYIPICAKNFPYITNFFNGTASGYHPYARITYYDGTPYANKNVSMRLCIVPFTNS